jgi:filamentous hemagglutinin family protein
MLLYKKLGMSQSFKDWRWRIKIASYWIICLAIATPDERVMAQITSDRTLGSENSTVNTVNSSVDRIDGGAIRGKNLFHSFQEFNIGEGRGTYFTNPTGIENIISRVTGGQASNLQGTLGVLGNANLFLLNPSGIVFGRNASLDVSGSFMASTASSLNFADGIQFSATDAQTSTLLTVSVPIGLQFGLAPQSIINRSQASPDGAVNSLFLPVGLQVQTGKTLAFVGGDINLEGGNLTTAGGRIELGSVAGNSLVIFNPTPQGWNLSYEGVRSFQDIQLSQQTVINASGENSGYIQIQGRDLTLKETAQILAETQGAGDGGGIRINLRKLIAQDGSQISTASSGFYLFEPPYLIPAKGKGGNLTVIASESVELSGISTPDKRFSGLSSATFSAGNAGDITVNTRKLIVRDGGRITTDSSDVILPEQRIPATGKGGNLTVNAAESVELTNGVSNLTGLFTATQGSGDAGNLSLSTETLIVRDGAEVAVNSEGIGNAGNLNILANSIRVENGGRLTATSKLSSDGGNINLQNLDLLTLRNNGEISTSAEGAGNGGNINIDTDNLVLTERSNITAKAVDGRGGNISITTQGLFVSPDSTIDATSDRGINGIVEIRRPDVDPSAELVILPANVVDVSGLIAQGCSVGGVASGESSFAITGRGGLPPTPAEATRSESILADLGIAEKSSGRLPNPFGNISRVKVRSQKSKAILTPPETSNKVNPAPLVEATGWVVGSNGEVVLTAAVTTDTLNIPWFRPHRCNGT